MSISPKAITLHEGYNDLGTFEIDITDIEQSNDNPVKTITEVHSISRTLLFKFELLSDLPIPLEYRGVFTVKGRVESEWVQYEQYPNADGFVKINTPVLPVVARKFVDTIETTVVRLNIVGELDERAEEMYLEVNGGGAMMYTLIWDIFVADGNLAIFDGDATYYPLTNTIAVSADITAIHITKLGVVFGYDEVLIEWTNLGTIEFTTIEFPENLTSYSDGFYQTNVDTGSLTQGDLGAGAFELYTSVVTNPESYNVDVSLSIFIPGSLVYSNDFNFLIPGDTDYIPVVIDASPPVPTDTSPTLELIQTISGVTFSTEFLDFLVLKELGTAEAVRKAGPITYIEDFPSEDVGAEELATLQGHVDLYSINTEIAQNQRLIDTGYGDVFKIANTPRDIYLADVVDASLSLFRAAQIQEIAIQDQKLVSNFLAGALTDLRLADPTTPIVEGSTFVSTAFTRVLNSCGCDDCKSGVSPFAYLMDLIKYGAAHLHYNGTPTTYHPNSYTNFIALITTKFLQPFGTLNVDCHTLHDEFCRVRLVTEVIEKVALAATIPYVQGLTLATERNQFLMLVYKTILTQAGTSITELRDVITIQNEEEKIKAAKKLSNKLGIPLYDPSYPDFTADQMWLSFNGGSPALNELTAVNLERIFGFRDTIRDVLTNTPVSLFEQWHSAYLRDVWKNQDYLFSNYSREGVVPASPLTYKDNWKPIIDPDIIGWQDMTYLTSIYGKAMWVRRKEDTDDFLQYCLTDSTNISRTSVDFKGRILKVIDRDITTHIIDDDQIKIQDPITPFAWIAFDVVSRNVVGTDTNITLAKPTPAMFQPNGATPKMRYRRAVSVIPGSASTPGVNITIDWPNPIMFDGLVSGYARLESTAIGSTPYSTTASAPQTILTVTFNANEKQITLTFNTGQYPNASFFTGTVTFVYEVEVPLYTTEIIDPQKVCDELFNTPYVYNMLGAPGGLGGLSATLSYSVWDIPIGWSTDTYSELKIIYDDLLAGTETESQLAIIRICLKISIGTFKRMMTLLAACEQYLVSMYTVKRPTSEELYELASIFRTSGKAGLRDRWVHEEIMHDDGTNPIILQLSGQYFWKSLTEPFAGSWDPSLQTSDDGIPIIDPEILKKETMLINPEAQIYLDLYAVRKQDLTDKFDQYMSFITVSAYDDAFIQMMNEINTGLTSSGYSIPEYDVPPDSNLPFLINDILSSDLFKQKKAKDALWLAFAISSEDFLEVMAVRNGYESIDPTQMPSLGEMQKAVKILVSAFKRNQLYPGTGGWLDVESTLNAGDPVMYYNVMKMYLAPGRSLIEERIEWQQTLEAWNRMPTIQPDIVPPENIVNFVSANWVYTTWNSRYTTLISNYNTLASYINSSVVDAGTLFTNFKDQIDLIISRLGTFTPLGPQDYLHYFTDIKDKENKGEDIRPIIYQLGIAITEYRFLRNIYDVLDEAPSALTSPLIESEYNDIINILIAIRSRNITFSYIQVEHTQGIILDMDYFLNYKPTLTNFPLTDLPVYNQWRSPYKLRKAWIDFLQTRIDRESAIKNNWKNVLQEAEDRNMPLLRDALIRALTVGSELWQDAAERLAQTYFIETKDNCCVKHTRVSFAIETLQGLIFAIQNGIYDDFVADFDITAPNFKQEWQWIGSYSTWRSATLVFYYPENLLYPTLKKLQSPGFRSLSSQIQTANNLSPEKACDLATEFKDYLDDIVNLNMICTATTKSEILVDNFDQCCKTKALKNVTYFFGQAGSGITYYNIKQYDDNKKGALGFWEKLSIPAYANVLGSFILEDNIQFPYGVITTSLYLFYTTEVDTKIKLFYIKKDLYDASSKWSESQSADIPDSASSLLLVNIEACQQDGLVLNNINSGTLKFYAGFLFTYRNLSTNVYDTYYEKFSAQQKKFVSTDIIYSENNLYPFTGIRQRVSPGIVAFEGVWMICETKIRYKTVGLNNVGTSVMTIPFDAIVGATGLVKIVGAFNSTTEPYTIIIALTDENYYPFTFEFKKVKLNFTISGNTITYTAPTITTNYLTKNGFDNITSLTKICPVSSDSETVVPFFEIQSDELCKIGGNLNVAAASTTCNLTNPFFLIPSLRYNLSIQSADCISNLSYRTLLMKDNVLANIEPTTGTALDGITCSTSNLELVYEAYYYVPMLLALDQQRRGQFDAALAWYRSVYDYTNSVNANRKIFYGLVLEQTTITNSYIRDVDWLLDPLNPHFIAKKRTNAYTRYTIMNIIQCMFSYADREFTLDTVETVPIARKLYTEALALLKVSGLNLNPNLCAIRATGYIEMNVDLPADERTFINLFGNLQGELESLGDAALIESISGNIADLINSGTEDTYAEKFAEAFDLIEETRPPAPDTETVSAVIEASADRFNNAYRYLFAIDDHKDFGIEVASMYASAVAQTSGIDVAEIDAPESVDQISWLYDELPANDESYQFRFATSEGVQLLPGNLAFDPLAPNQRTLGANIAYSNAPVMFMQSQTSMPASYTPLISFNFCIPQNPIYKALQLKGNLELFKIFNCRNIAGMVRELQTYTAATDTTTGIPIIGATGNLVQPGLNSFAPSQYRFSILIERAKQIAAQAQQMESLFLAALEKEDAANYDQLRARQDLETAKATVKLQDLRITQANDEKVVADIQLNKATFMQTNFDNWLSAGLNSFENASLDALNTAISFLSQSAILGAAGTLASGDPRSSAAQLVSIAVGAFRDLSQISSLNASLFAQMASYDRRAQEWSYQKNLAGYDISIANQQIKIAQDNVRIVTQEREIAQLNTDHAQDNLEFLKNKFTNAELYNFMGSVLERSYSYMLNLSTAVARTAENQLYFERQEEAGPFILDDYWQMPSGGFTPSVSGGSSDRRGLTGSARLLVDITRLDQYAFDTAKRKLQMTKVISLSQNFPSEFQAFKETGVLNFELTNQMFDYDFPGHYLRLINTVKTTVIGLLPVYDSVKASLTADTISYTIIGGTTFQRAPIRRLEVDSVALTSANNATGLFELQPMQNQFLNPFEGMGVESRWELKMPQFSNRFDYSNIADVLLTVEYTALDSYQYRSQVLQDLDNSISFNRGFSFKNNFPDQWYELAEVNSNYLDFGVTIELKREMFPEGIENLKLNGRDIVLYFVREDGYNQEISIADFNLITAGNPTEGETTNGIYHASSLTTSLGDASPLLKLRLLFVNNLENRNLFSEGKVKDIMLLVPCKAELKNYPL